MFKRVSTSRLAAIASCALLAGLVATGVVDNPARAGELPAEINYDQPERVPTLRSEQLRIPHRRVIIGDHSITPKVIVLDHGERFGWLSHSRAPSRIVFEREVAHSMFCRSLVNFTVEDDELRSSELQVHDVANFCQLEPGRYPYRVVRTDPTNGASRRLEGWVVVRERNDSTKAHQVARIIEN